MTNECHSYLHVVVDGAALRDGLDNGGEVVVGQDHVRRLLGHRGAGDAHGDADVGELERGGVVDAVARHGHDVPVVLEQPHDVLLVLGLRAAEHAPPRRGQQLHLLRALHAGELPASHGLPLRVGAQVEIESTNRKQFVTFKFQSLEPGALNTGF